MKPLPAHYQYRHCEKFFKKEYSLHATCKSVFSILLKNFQHVLALVFAVKEVNNNPKILENVSLGFHIYDSYFNAMLTYRNTLSFLCTLKRIIPNYSCDIQRNLMAVVGGLDSESSFHMANILSIYKIPQVAYWLANECMHFYIIFSALQDCWNGYKLHI